MTLREIFKPISKELQLVRQQIRFQFNTLYEEQCLHDDQKTYIDRFITHFFHAPGKGLRPALVLLSAKLAGPLRFHGSSYQSLIQLATAVELIHSASLTHDDIVDKAQYRRGQISLNEKYGDRVAVVVGDLLILQAFSLLLNLEIIEWQKKQHIIQLAYRTAQKMCVGEMCQHQVISEQRPAKRDEYLRLLESKTASLMSVSCQCGAILTGKDQTDFQQMADFGLHFGLAFQLADDLKDRDALLKEEIDLVAIAKEYIAKAKDDLQSFNGNPVKKNLIGLCDMLLPGHDSAGIFDQDAML